LSGEVDFLVVDNFMGEREASKIREEAEVFQRAGAMESAAMGGGRTTEAKTWKDHKVRGDCRMWLEREKVGTGIGALISRLAAIKDTIGEKVEGQGTDLAGRISIQLAFYPGNESGARYVAHMDSFPPHIKKSAEVGYRKVTAIYYLNQDWDPDFNEGSLRIFTGPTGIMMRERLAKGLPAMPPKKEKKVDETGGLNSLIASFLEAPDAASLNTFNDTGDPDLVSADDTKDLDPLFDRLVMFRSDVNPHEVLPTFGFGEEGEGRYAITMWWYCKEEEAVVAAQPPLNLPEVKTDAGTNADPTALPIQHDPSAPSGSAEELPSIFVSIPAFRDDECKYTIQDLYLKAAFPGRINVGVYWQHEDEDGVCSWGLPRPNLTHSCEVRVISVGSKAAKGPCSARVNAHRLLDNEDYVLQIDSHTRFRWPFTTSRKYTKLAASWYPIELQCPFSLSLSPPSPPPNLHLNCCNTDPSFPHIYGRHFY
jgi:hypothetical protein